MKRKSIALLLALMMCLALLSACGGDNTPKTPEPPSTESTVQPPADGKEEQPTQEPEQGEPKEDEPEESPEPVQEEPKEEDNAGTAFLKLLQEEWNNGFFEGKGPRHTYYKSYFRGAFILDGVVYIRGMEFHKEGYDDPYLNDYCSYDIASKEFRKTSISADIKPYDSTTTIPFFMDGSFYFPNYSFRNESEYQTRRYDSNGELLDTSQYAGSYIVFEKGFLVVGADRSVTLLSHSFEKIADIPYPQREVAHGLKENVKLDFGHPVVADGTIYVSEEDADLYRLNMDTYEWEDVGAAPRNIGNISVRSFLGRYTENYEGSSIYDCITGEEVFNSSLAGVHPPVEGLCYFGGDKYLGYDRKDYRWVNLKDLTMSDPLPFPQVYSSSNITILDDTYCVYYDDYGWFLWNYSTGEEEPILMLKE